MNEVKLFSNPEFGEIRTTTINNEPWFVLKDLCAAFGDQNYRRVASRLEDDEKGVSQIATPGGNQNMTIVNESGLYSTLFAMQPEKARGVTDEYIIQRQEQLRRFKRWVTSEVLPSIRKHGGYIAGQEELSGEELMEKALQFADRKLKEKEAQIRQLTAETEQQKQGIADFAPKAQYLDVILSSSGTMATSQIAADYNMSAKQLNKILHEAGIQHNVNGQWILYRDKMGMGYTKSVTIPIVRSDGRADTKMHTHWTQKGRLMIHDVLAGRGIQAAMDM